MPKTLKEVQAGDTCPIDGGPFVVDAAQNPETLIDRHTRNAPTPFAAARFAERVREKAHEHGLIHKCVTCGYRSRFAPDDAGQADRDRQTRDQQDREQQAREQRDKQERDQRAADDRERWVKEQRAIDDRERQDRERSEREARDRQHPA